MEKKTIIDKNKVLKKMSDQPTYRQLYDEYKKHGIEPDFCEYLCVSLFNEVMYDNGRGYSSSYIENGVPMDYKYRINRIEEDTINFIHLRDYGPVIEDYYNRLQPILGSSTGNWIKLIFALTLADPEVGGKGLSDDFIMMKCVIYLQDMKRELQESETDQNHQAWKNSR